jgi:hypothetical protein
MIARRIHIPLTALIVGLILPLFTPSVTAQKGGKPTSKPATGLFRCPGVDCPVADPSAVPIVITDAIRGDQDSLPYSSADGAKIDTHVYAMPFRV